MRTRILIRHRPWVAVLLLALLAPATAPGAGPDFEPLVRLRLPTSLLAHDGNVYCGTADGGVLVWSEDEPDASWRWLAGSELSSAAITDLYWTGSYLWVATGDAGMTRVADPAGAPRFDLYANSLRSAAVTAVAGTVVDGVERVWYGAVGEGLGEIIGDQPGALYTAASDGLVSDVITDLAWHEGVLFVATAAGVSRFADNVFTDTNQGLGDLDVRVLGSIGGELYLGGADGVYMWSDGFDAWQLQGDVGLPVENLAFHEGYLYAATERSGGQYFLYRWTGTAFGAMPTPAARTPVMAGGRDLWMAGWKPADGMPEHWTWPLFRARQEAGDTYSIWDTDEITVPSPSGAAFDADGRLWLGDFTAETLALRQDDGLWRGVYETADSATDSSGLINHGGNLLFVAPGADGTLWSGQLGAGVLRHDPLSWHMDVVVTDNSGLGSGRVINGVPHPDGSILFMFDNKDFSGILLQVLTDPEHWRNPDNWATPSLLDIGGSAVLDALVVRNDIIWLAVQGTGGGVVRWDVNGPDAGPDDPLTWTDDTDDDWSYRVSNFPNTFLDPKEAAALALDASGNIWVGGNGLVGMSFNESSGALRTVAAVGGKTLDEEGLISSDVVDVAVDRHGYVWAVTSAGLNRVRVGAGGVELDAWFDVVTYSGTRDLGILYSPSRVSDLPGVSTAFSRLMADAAGERLVLSSSRGAAVIDVGDQVGGGASDGGGLYLYPNPWLPGEDDRLAVGGLPAGANEYLDVGIYTIEGQLVYRDDRVTLDQGFWSGSSRVGNPVTTGMYVVRVSWRGNQIMRTLAVVR